MTKQKLSILGSILLLTGCLSNTPSTLQISTPATASNSSPVSFSTTNAIIQQHCTSCHSTFKTPSRLKNYAYKINRVVVRKSMPPQYRSQMTQDERNLIAKWFEQGANID